MDIQTRVLLEGNLANEVGLIVLDTIELFCGHFKVSERTNVSRIWGLKTVSPFLIFNFCIDSTTFILLSMFFCIRDD